MTQLIIKTCNKQTFFKVCFYIENVKWILDKYI